MSTTVIAPNVTTSLDAVVNANIRGLARVAGLSGVALAQALDMSQQAVSVRLSGGRAWKINDLERVAAVFGVEPWELLRPDMTITPAQMLGRGGVARPKGLEPLTFWLEVSDESEAGCEDEGGADGETDQGGSDAPGETPLGDWGLAA